MNEYHVMFWICMSLLTGLWAYLGTSELLLSKGKKHLSVQDEQAKLRIASTTEDKSSIFNEWDDNFTEYLKAEDITLPSENVKVDEFDGQPIVMYRR